MRCPWVPIALAVAVGALAPLARADVYTWTDEKGVVHFTEEPPPASSKRARKVPLPRLPDVPAPAPEQQKEAATTTAPAPARAAPPAPKPLPSVELFTTRWCPYCQRAREYLRARGVPFVEHDIEQDRAARERKIALTGNEAVPTLLIGDRVIVGFRPADIQRALER